jgi:hypothetical protein
VPSLDRRPCAGRWQGAPLLFLSATVPLLVRLDARVCALPRRLLPGVGINILKSALELVLYTRAVHVR